MFTLEKSDRHYHNQAIELSRIDPGLLEGTRGQEVVPGAEEDGAAHGRQVEEKVL